MKSESGEIRLTDKEFDRLVYLIGKSMRKGKNKREALSLMEKAEMRGES